VTIEVAREAVREYENLGKTEEKFRKPIGRRALHSIMAGPAISLVGVGLVALVGLYSLSVRMPDIATDSFRDCEHQCGAIPKSS
jgi:hypothetical protein